MRGHKPKAPSVRHITKGVGNKDEYVQPEIFKSFLPVADSTDGMLESKEKPNLLNNVSREGTLTAYVTLSIVPSNAITAPPFLYSAESSTGVV